MKLTLALLFAGAGLLSGQQALQIVTDSLPDATVGTTYLQQLATTGGICQEPGTTSITIDSGALPAGFIVTAPGIEAVGDLRFPYRHRSLQFHSSHHVRSHASQSLGTGVHRQRRKGLHVNRDRRAAPGEPER